MMRVDTAACRAFARDALHAKGLREDLAAQTAGILIEADLMGHNTHGIAQLPAYLQQIDLGGMACDGAFEVTQDAPAAFAIAGNRLPGAHVLTHALREALERSRVHPVVTATIADCFHIGALQTYLPPVIEQGRIALIFTTDPGASSVAPFGAVEPVLTSNPLAFAVPGARPIMADICTSLISNGTAAQARQAGAALPGAYVLGSDGRTTDDPEALFADPPGTILPLGGTGFGHKGFALGLLVETLALAVPGYGRSRSRTTHGEGVFVQVIDPGFFAGDAVFAAEIDALTGACISARAADGSTPVRLPGQGAMRRRKEQLDRGLRLAPHMIRAMELASQGTGVSMPPALPDRATGGRAHD